MRRRRVLLLVAIAVIGVVYGFIWYTRPRSTVVLRNAGPNVLRAVMIHIGDRSYPVGDVRVKESASAKVHLGGKSRIGIAFTDPAGQGKQLAVDVFTAEGQANTVTVTVKDDQVDRIENSVKPPE